NIDAHMAARLQGPRGCEHKQAGMGVKHRFLKRDRAKAEGIAQHHHGKFRQDDIETTPGRGAADGAIDPVDGGGAALKRVPHGPPAYYNESHGTRSRTPSSP